MTKVSLEGDMSKFPVTNADFGLMPGRDAKSAWYLDWDPKDLHAPLLNGVQLFVNDAHPIVAQAVTTGSELEGAQYIRDALKLDVARTLIAGALTNPDFDFDTDFEEDMVGAVLQRLLRSVFPRRNLNELRYQQTSTPGDIEASVASTYLGSFSSSAAG